MNLSLRFLPPPLVSALLSAGLLAGPVFAADGLAIQGVSWPGVPAATARAGDPDNRLAPHFYLELIAQGLDPLENPSGPITHFGYLSDSDVHPVEQTKTEPDENTYLVLDHNPGGPEAGYDYGRHFLFQGHENGGDLAYITRMNLDVASPDRHVTLLTPVGADGKTHLNSIDGSTWDPFTRTLLFAQEAGGNGGVVELSPEFGSAIVPLYGVMGRGGYEGIHPDDRGNIYLVEDAGGTSVNIDPNDPTSPKKAKVPNSYIYRFVPKNPAQLAAGGVLQALQVSVDGAQLTYVPVDAAHPVGDAFSTAQLKLHTVGQSWPVKWVTVHNTDVDGFGEFNANLAARAAGATPLKRPENGQFMPGTGFRTFVFDVTGDTDALAGAVPALAARGAWGGIFRLDLNPTRDAGTLRLVVLGDAEHAAFDNLTFVGADVLLAAEDRGDTLHRQLNKLDSIWAYDLDRTRVTARRWLALGRDREAETDVALGEAGTPGFQNDGDNEPTGLHVSDGDASVAGLVGRRVPSRDALIFFTQQHGENNVYLVIPASDHRD
jgi:hypothetical protein